MGRVSVRFFRLVWAGGLLLTAISCQETPRRIVVAAVSSESRPYEKEANLERIDHWSREAAAAGADLVLFPELTISGWTQQRKIREIAEPVDGPAVQQLIALAKEIDIIIAAGLTEAAGNKAHITHVVVDGNGIIAMHRKSALAGGKNGEGRIWDQGNDANVFEIEGIRFGIAICFESVNPETCQTLRANGAEVILAPYANGTQPEELVTGKRPYTYMRATENGVWYVACDATPHNRDGSLRQGAAYVISPDGELVAITPDDAQGENMVVYELTVPFVMNRK